MKQKPFEGTSSAMRADTPWLASEDLMDTGDVVVEIGGVFHNEDAEFEDGRKEDVFSLSFKGKKKQLVLNATNRKTLVKMFGSKVVKWIGRAITLYVKPDVKAFGETRPGLRIRPTPAKASAPAPPPSESVEVANA